MTTQINSSQTVFEVPNSGNAQVNVSQVVNEVLETGAGLNVRCSQVVLEVLCWNPSSPGWVAIIGQGG